MNLLAKTFVAAAIGLSGMAVPALAQSGPNYETPTNRSDFPQVLERRSAPSIWFRGHQVYRNDWPTLHHGNTRDRWSRDSHEEWCYGTYRSYRAWDNTFKPHRGPRQQCRSPYG